MLLLFFDVFWVTVTKMGKSEKPTAFSFWKGLPSHKHQAATFFPAHLVALL
jgi:hypothetical protein